MQISRPITITVVLLVTAVFAFFFIAPEYKNFRNLQQELSEKKAEYNAKFDYFSAVGKAYNQLKSRPEDMDKIDDALPTDPNMGDLIYFFQKKSLESGVMLSNVYLSRSSAVKTSENLKEIIFSLNLRGSYSSLENFISALQKSSRIFEVTNISFNYGDQNQSSGIYSFNLEVKTYSY